MRLALSLASLALVACEVSFPHAARPMTSLRLHGAAAFADAVVTIDEERVGSLALVAAHGVALPQGTHQVTVQQEGYFPWDELLEAKPGVRRLDVDVTLTPVPE